MEQRKTTRYPLCAPILFNWTYADGVCLQGGGFTRDISTDGLFVRCDRPPLLETALNMEVLISLGEPTAPVLRLRGPGMVVRVEERENRRGFAAKIDFDLNPDEMDPN